MSILRIKYLKCDNSENYFCLFERLNSCTRKVTIILRNVHERAQSLKFRAGLYVCILGRNAGLCVHHTLGLSET
jgi:hypothetical protein